MFVLAACGASQTATPPAAKPPPPTLSAIFWVDYPLVKAGQSQSANLIVKDLTGRPVSNASAVLILSCGDFEHRYYFQMTDATGHTRVAIDVPATNGKETVVASVQIIDPATNKVTVAQTQFDVLQPGP